MICKKSQISLEVRKQVPLENRSVDDNFKKDKLKKEYYQKRQEFDINDMKALPVPDTPIYKTLQKFQNSHQHINIHCQYHMLSNGLL